MAHTKLYVMTNLGFRVFLWDPYVIILFCDAAPTLSDLRTQDSQALNCLKV